ncbi:MAG: hypothetical protein M3N45_11480 [Actinomycetota bacterium]|nr:hypothetical protein [Actinomycetota bacterium]
MSRTKNFKVLAVLASVIAALAASVLVLSLSEKPAKAQADGGEYNQGRTVDKLDKDPEGNPIATGELIVTYQEDPSSLTAQDAAQEVEGEAKKNFPTIDAQLLSFPDVKNERAEEPREQALEEKKTALEEDPNVEAVDYNHLIKPDQVGPSRDSNSIGWPDMTPNDQFYGQQWGYPKINAPQA